MKLQTTLTASLFLFALMGQQRGFGQSFGLELHNTLMPASGAMGGASIARPQDHLSAINGNPATMAQVDGTHFTFSGTVVDPKIHLTQTAAFPAFNPIVTPFSAESNYPVSLLGNIGISQDLEILDLPGTVGLGFMSNAGAGTNFVGAPESNGTATSLVVFEFIAGAGLNLTDNLSAGASFQLGLGILDPPFVGLGRMTPDFGVRGSFGLDYRLDRCTNVGLYYQTLQSFTFEEAILLNLGDGTFGGAADMQMDLPQNLGFGIANNSLMDGNLLLAADLLWKNWDGTDGLRALYNDQLVVQLGSQYSAGRYKLRMGYAWAENPIQTPPGVNIGGISPPGLVAAAQLVQSQLAVINQHRISAGIGAPNVFPGIDVDLLAGGMLNDSQALGASIIDIESWWVGFGLTWRFGNRCECGATGPLCSCN